MRQRTRRSKDLKFKAAIETIQGDGQVGEVTTEYGVHPKQVRDWKRQLLGKGADVLSGKQDAERKQLS
ncbi:MAG: transposase [Alkalispirochaetaceae bacterium]